MKLFRRNFYRPMVTGFSLLILLFIFSAFVSFYDTNQLGDLVTTIYKHPLEVSNASLKANMGVVSIHRTMKDVVLAENEKDLQVFVEKVDLEERGVFNSLDIVRDNILGEEGKELERNTRQLFTDWRMIRDEVIGLVRQGKIREAARITTGKGANHVLKLESKMNSLTSYARNKADTFFKSANKVKNRVLFTTLSIAILGIAVSIAIILFLIRQISYSFNLVNEASRKITLEQEFTQRAIDSQRDTFMVFDPEKRTPVRWNKTFENMVGYSHDEIRNQKFPDAYLNAEDIERSKKVIEKTLRYGSESVEIHLIGKNEKVLMECITSVIEDENGGVPKKYILSVGRNITQRKKEELERERIIKELEHAIEEINTLEGIIPICSYCKQIRNDEGYWLQVEQYVHEHTDAQFSHGICPDCEKKFFSDL